MGLLDYIGTPEGQGLLSAAFGGLAGARQGTPFNNIGRAGVSGLVGYNQARDQDGELDQRKQRQQLFDMQLKQLKQQQTDAQLVRDNEAAFRNMMTSPQQQADVNNALTPAQFGAVAPTLGLSGAGPVDGGMGFTAGRVTPPKPVNRDDQQLYQAMQLGLIKPMEYITATTKSRTPLKLSKGDVLVDPETYQPLVRGAADAPDAPNLVQEYEYALSRGYKGSFDQFKVLGPAMQIAAGAPVRQAQIDAINYGLPPAPPPPLAGVPVKAPDGKVYMFPTQQAADTFKAKAGLK